MRPSIRQEKSTDFSNAIVLLQSTELSGLLNRLGSVDVFPVFTDSYIL